MSQQTETAVPVQPVVSFEQGAVLIVVIAMGVGHLLNDMVQSMIVAIYPNLQQPLHLTFARMGIVSGTFQLTASLLQPFVGMYTDKHPQPFALPVGMTFTLAGLLTLSQAASFASLLVGVALVGIGSAIFHPEASRIARTASGGKHGLAQSLFQLGGNGGSALGPLLASKVVTPYGQGALAWFSIASLTGIGILARAGAWYKQRTAGKKAGSGAAARRVSHLTRGQVQISLAVLVALMFSKFFYLASISNYYTFYLIKRFHVSVADSQMYLFLFLVSTAVGTMIGGPIGDRFGRRLVIWVSILGVLPFSLLLPHVGLFWTAALSVPIGLVIASAFSAIVVYAQDLLPGRVGLISGVFFGLAFGLGGLGAAVLGAVADRSSIEFVYSLCAWLPAIGLLTMFLPDVETRSFIGREASQ